MDKSNSSERVAPDPEKPIFEAMLTPHRSLGRVGFLVVMGIATVITLAHSTVFMVSGAWPVGAFFGLDLALLIGAFWLNYRSARARETVSVSRTDLLISKYAPSGRSTEFRWNPLWARFHVSRHDEIGITRMDVSGEGRATDIGSFLNPEDRETFADAFSGALARARR